MIEAEILRRTLSQIPMKPGVYLMRNAAGEIIYVGKSRRLKNRVTSYFMGKQHDNKTQMLVHAIESIEFIVTTGEIEALILENNLIKRHHPRYNVRLKDSKTHPYIMVTVKESFPRILKVRKVSFKDGNLYFGPFPDEYGLKRIIQLMTRIHGLCSAKIPLNPEKPAKRPCLRFNLRLCKGACIGAVSPEDYRKGVETAVEILSGKMKPDFDSMRTKMAQLSSEFRFEEAAELRDTISAFESFFAAQKVEFTKPVDGDLWGIADSPDRLIASIFFIRGGKLLGNRTIEVEREPGAGTSRLLGSIMTRFYDTNLIPPKIFTSIPPQPLDSLKEFLAKLSDRQVRIGIPVRGAFKRLLKNADENAVEMMKNLKAGDHDRVAESVLDLEQRLALPKTPFRVECMDISHIQGVDPVASLTVAINGEPRKGEYRLFHIKTVEGIDDPAAIGEVTKRRFSRLINEGKPLCDLLIVDGGITQARSAKFQLDVLKATVPVWGLAKREETLVPPHGDPVKLPVNCPAMRLLIRLRDEAHRFANSFQKKVHAKRVMRSALLSLPGVGIRTLQKVIGAFGSVDRAAQVMPEEISEKAGIPQKTAELIHASIQRKLVNL